MENGILNDYNEDQRALLGDDRYLNDDYWMTCLNNSNDADIDDYCVGQYVFENGIWNGKGIRYPELCFLSTRQTEQATQSTQALENQKGILESTLLILCRICRKMYGMTGMAMDLRRDNDKTVE